MVKIFLRMICTVAILFIFFCTFQYLREPISQTKAIDLAKLYILSANKHMHHGYNSSKIEFVELNSTPFKRISGNSTWDIFVDGVDVIINANSGQLVRMVFPSDGVITYVEHPEWFDLTSAQE